LRREVGAAVTAGAAACVRCGLAIERDEPWDLDHADGSDLYLGLSHASCNRAQLSLRRRYEDYPEDDPERGIFWGPPCELTGQPRRWSRVWFDWRSA
jgi:hypothetical protein